VDGGEIICGSSCNGSWDMGHGTWGITFSHSYCVREIEIGMDGWMAFSGGLLEHRFTEARPIYCFCIADA
jgi:hypothetical protein